MTPRAQPQERPGAPSPEVTTPRGTISAHGPSWGWPITNRELNKVELEEAMTPRPPIDALPEDWDDMTPIHFVPPKPERHGAPGSSVLLLAVLVIIVLIVMVAL